MSNARFDLGSKTMSLTKSGWALVLAGCGLLGALILISFLNSLAVESSIVGGTIETGVAMIDWILVGGGLIVGGPIGLILICVGLSRH